MPLHPFGNDVLMFRLDLDYLQSAFSLKIRLVLDLIQRDCKPRCYDETRKDGLLTLL